MLNNKTDEIITYLEGEHLKRRSSANGMWIGRLSSSAISTSVTIFALHMADAEKYHQQIQDGAQWLIKTMLPDGSWGDTPESPSNMTATLLSYAALSATGFTPDKTKHFLQEKFNGYSNQHIISGVLQYYGKDLTFSAPILVMCALAGIISSWKEIPQLPFEVAVLPQKLFRFFKLPVVSYAIPALIAVGILRYKKGRKNFVREWFIPKCLRVLNKLQPSNGGFLEAPPLTGFVAMCMCGSGLRTHQATLKAVDFLVNTKREDGSWPIDTNLSSWVTALSVRALETKLTDAEKLAHTIQSNAFTFKHPFTGAKEGGWAWTNLPGAVPDADDTAGALVALHILRKGNICKEIEKGIEWLLDLQNSDGGIPTFCKGWGKLPFDRSSPDITAHSLLAFQLWSDKLPKALQKKCIKSTNRMLRWMKKEQAENGSWIPLWFGDQDVDNEQSPVYGTALTVEYLSCIKHPMAQDMTSSGVAYLLAAQNDDGGWGGAVNVPSKITLTARALSALSHFQSVDNDVLTRAVEYLYARFSANELLKPEAIGLYFSRLWYSEEMYNITYVLHALHTFKKKHIDLNNINLNISKNEKLSDFRSSISIGIT